MAIRFHCDHCGKLIKAPDSAGGRQGKCPACEGVNYIPAPPEEAEELPLDEAEERLMREQEAALFAKDQAILAESSAVETQPRLSQMDTADVDGKDLHHLVVNYCLDMFAGNLERAATHVAKLNQHTGPNHQAVKDFQDGKVREPAMANIPAKVLAGFLKALHKQVK